MSDNDKTWLLRADLSAANKDWSRANTEARRAVHAMAIIPRTEPLYAELAAGLAAAKAARTEAGGRISALSLAILDEQRRATA